jgi:hypothetical protein
MFRKIPKFLKSKIRSLIRPKKTEKIKNGLPDGIDLDTINNLTLRHFEGHISHISHLHISGWKKSGAYKLYLQTEKNHTRTLIFKNAVYYYDHIPALDGLPINPGPAEYQIYKNANGNLSKYLPKVYLCREIVPNRHYQYILEDLDGEYQRNTSPETIFNTINEMPAIHLALNESLPDLNQNDLPKYDRKYSIDLLQYVRKNLEHYHQKSGSKTVSTLLKLWPGILKIYNMDKFHDSKSTQLIHGDFNSANVLIHKKNLKQIKLIDWEWAGMGTLCADLASLLKGTLSGIEKDALAAFSKLNNDNRADIIKERLYHWCKMERGLLDAAFCAAQVMKCPVKTRFNLTGFIEKSMNRALDGYQELNKS